MILLFTFLFQSSVFAQTPAATATKAEPAAPAAPMVWDVSGATGAEGAAGLSPSEAVDFGANGDNGQAGKEGSTGQNGGEIHVNVGFVEDSRGKQVFVKGYFIKPGSTTQETIDTVLETEKIQQLQFIARGGDGGKGGDGGDGGNGAKGKNGRTGSEMVAGKDGQSGKAGGSGGAGGDGARGGRGGDGGIVKVVLQRGSELLAPLIRVDVIAGRGGVGGMGGRGGAGGRGGSGGSASCETFNSGNTSLEFSPIFTKCGRNGYSGADGATGKNGRTAGNAGNGSNGSMEFLYSDGSLGSKMFALELFKLDTDEEYKDNVFEPSEKITIKGFSIKNFGKSNVPPGEYKFRFFDKEERVFAQAPLEAGQTVRIDLHEPITLSVDSLKETLPISLRINNVLTHLKMPRGLATHKPLELVDVQIPVMNEAQTEGRLILKTKNATRKRYGVQGEIMRTIKLFIQAKNNQSLLSFKESGGVLKSFKEGYLYEIPLMESEEVKSIEVPFTVSKGVVAGWREPLMLELRVGAAEGKEKVLSSQEASLRFSIDPSKAIDYNLRLSDMKISCVFPKFWFSSRTIKKISIKKEPNAAAAKVQFYVRMGLTTPPVFDVGLEEMQPLLIKLFSGAEINHQDWVEFFNTTLRPLTQKDPKSDWQIHLCQ